MLAEWPFRHLILKTQKPNDHELLTNDYASQHVAIGRLTALPFVNQSPPNQDKYVDYRIVLVFRSYNGSVNISASLHVGQVLLNWFLLSYMQVLDIVEKLLRTLLLIDAV